MTVQELIERLSEYEPDTEVRLAIQPGWPFEHGVGEIGENDPDDEYEILRQSAPNGWSVQDSEGEEHFSAGTEEECETWVARKVEETERCVYIGEAGQIGYLPTAARRAIGWS